MMGEISKGRSGEREERFELLKLLGTGGFAHTYHARVLDEDLVEDFGSEEVALKIPLSRRKEKALKNEVTYNAILHVKLKGLDSTNIVRYLGFDWFDGKCVMAMEYVPSGSLRGRMGEIGRQKRLPAEEAIQVAEGVLKGLIVIHQERLFHRDIKPENILLAGRTAKIADLGISRMLNSNEFASTTTGTLYYMSPETLGENGASFPSDLWSLGVTLYEMVTGRLPFGNDDTPPGKLVDLIRSSDPALAHEVCPEVPRELSKVVETAMAKDVSKRYRTAQEMLKALQKFKDRGRDEQLEKAMADITHLANEGEQTVVEARLKQIVTRFAGSTKAYQYLGEFYNRCQHFREAIEVFNQGLVIDPECPELLWDMALALQQVGCRAQAAQNIKKALAVGLDPCLERHARMLLRAVEKA